MLMESISVLVDHPEAIPLKPMVCGSLGILVISLSYGEDHFNLEQHH